MPTDANAEAIAAKELFDDQRAEEAEAAARAGLRKDPSRMDLRTTLAFSLLMQGRYREGFREAEGRDGRLRSPLQTLPYPEWDGQIAGKSILVCGEQGLGDEIQFARFIKPLRELGTARITLVCWPQLVRAFQDVGADLVIGREGTVSLPKHDYWTMAGSIPHRLGLDLADISGTPYLAAEPRSRGGIGLVERGNPLHGNDVHRSIPHGMLQEALPGGRLLEPEGDVYDSLCRIAGLDLLITVDTSWAHMAGALGVPCWVLLPYRGLDWRWMRSGSSTHWYASMRLFRQPEPGDWATVVKAVKLASAAI